MQVRFYHLTRQNQMQALPLLLSKITQRGHKVFLLCDEQDTVDLMNEHLWAYKAESFLPHGLSDDPHAPHHPVLLGLDANEPVNHADMLVIGQGAKLEIPAHYAVCCVLINGADAASVEASRVFWRECKALDYDLAYWQQTEQGGWEQKA